MISVKKRTGAVVPFEENRIYAAIQKAFDSAGVPGTDSRIRDLVAEVVAAIGDDHPEGVPIETIQDYVERTLVHNDLYEIGKRYIIYRQERAAVRAKKISNETVGKSAGIFSVRKRDASTEPYSHVKVETVLRRLTGDLAGIDLDVLLRELSQTVHEGITTSDLEDALILSASAFIERDPDYGVLASRLVRQKLYHNVFGTSVTSKTFDRLYRGAFRDNILLGCEAGYFDRKLGTTFHLDTLADSIRPERDERFGFIGMRTIRERYLAHLNGRVIETPQAFWMRVAMGLSINESDPETRAIEFYQVLSDLRFVPSTPTLFHSGTHRPQLSSCYLSTVNDDLAHIFKCIGDNAQMSKWSGGIGNDWTPIRATGAMVNGTHVESQGVVPFLKIANDTTVAINRSGKRRGATCAYLETWHLDIEDFLDLRRNTGDDRRRTHDMNTANWIPDLFMKRVRNNDHWTLFSPDEVHDLHDLFGREFETRYEFYEAEAASGRIRRWKQVDAQKLWKKMLTRLFETGHPWLTFKDPSNIRSPQDHVGVVHNSNLCTEITLNNSADETAVCNLGSINLARHMSEDGLNQFLLENTVQTAMRMLDNVVDINFYPTLEAQTSNLRHRPIGLGIMGVQDALFSLRIPIDHPDAGDFMDQTMEMISFHAILSSSRLARERGPYSSFPGSKWDRGILPFDTIGLLESERGVAVDVNRDSYMDWSIVRNHIKKYGMRNSNTMAIAPTATISNISGVYPSIEPIYKNLYVKANMSGEFTVVNERLVRDLKGLGIWNQEMLEQIKYYDGNISMIPSIPAEIKALYKEAFDIDPLILLDLTARRAKWIDQSQSHNVFMRGTSGKLLDTIYMAAWEKGLKTTYYLRTLAASQIEKSTLDAARFGYTQKREYHAADGPVVEVARLRPATEIADFDSLHYPTCDSCQ